MYARARGRRCPDPRHWSEARGRRGHVALPGLPRQGGAARLHPGRGDRPRRPGQGSPQRTQLPNLDDPHRTRDLRGESPHRDLELLPLPGRPPLRFGRPPGSLPPGQPPGPGWGKSSRWAGTTTGRHAPSRRGLLGKRTRRRASEAARGVSPGERESLSPAPESRGPSCPPFGAQGDGRGARPPALARLQAGFTEVAPIPFRGLALRPTAAAGHGTGWPRHRRVYLGKVEPCRGCLRIASRFSC